VVLAVSTSSLPAFANGPITSKLNLVAWAGADNPNLNTLFVQTSDTGTNYMAKTVAPSGCTDNNQTIDTIKMWQSLAQAALLSGKQIHVYFNVCGGINYITQIDLLP